MSSVKNKSRVPAKRISAQVISILMLLCSYAPLLLCSSALAGCSFVNKLLPANNSNKLKIVPVSSSSVANLSSNDVIEVMRTVGFSDEQILELGTELRDSLLYYGAAKVLLKKKTVVSFFVKRDNLFISSLRGNFIYNLKSGWIDLEPRSAVQKTPLEQGP